jgi:hypothetical protein
VIGRVELNGRPNLCSFADGHRHHVENHAIEIQKNVRPERNVVAIVAVEGRADHRAAANGRQTLAQQCSALIGCGAEGGVVAHHPGLCRLLIGLNLGIVGKINIAGQHPFFLSLIHGGDVARLEVRPYVLITFAYGCCGFAG